MDEVTILETAIGRLTVSPLPNREPCVRHRLAGSKYVIRCYACESGYEPKLKEWLSTIEPGVKHGTAASRAEARMAEVAVGT